MVGRPSGKKSCDDCSFKKRKCTHAEINIKRTLDSTLVEENSTFVRKFQHGNSKRGLRKKHTSRKKKTTSCEEPDWEQPIFEEKIEDKI